MKNYRFYWVFCNILLLNIIERISKTFIISPMDPNEIKSMIENGMSNVIVNVDGDGTHFEALIVSTEFEGKSLIERHKLVYGVLGDAMKERIHALSLKTFTPEQWKNQK